MVLTTIVRKIKAKEKEVRILILGLDNAGKTTILKKFAGEDVLAVSPTFGFEIKTLEYRDYKLNFWDVGGQSTIRAYWRNYYEETDVVIWTVDSADKTRILECKKELHNLLKEERLLGACLLIFANKQDSPNAMTVEDIVKYLQLDLIKTHMCYVEPCSALTGDGLTEGIDLIINDVSSRVFL